LEKPDDSFCPDGWNLGCDAVYFGKSKATFWRNLLTLSTLTGGIWDVTPYSLVDILEKPADSFYPDGWNLGFDAV